MRQGSLISHQFINNCWLLRCVNSMPTSKHPRGLTMWTTLPIHGMTPSLLVKSMGWLSWKTSLITSIWVKIGGPISPWKQTLWRKKVTSYLCFFCTHICAYVVVSKIGMPQAPKFEYKRMALGHSILGTPILRHTHDEYDWQFGRIHVCSQYIIYIFWILQNVAIF